MQKNTNKVNVSFAFLFLIKMSIFIKTQHLKTKRPEKMKSFVPRRKDFEQHFNIVIFHTQARFKNSHLYL